MLLLLFATAAQAATLVGFAELSADTFKPGPTSGQYIDAANGRLPPFRDQQPIQGFSALLEAGNGTYLVLSDNGFGSASNSSDYLLSIYHIQPDFRTAKGGSGSIEIKDVIRLGDPGHHIAYPVVNESRQLSGADLDPESFQRGRNGSLWIGEEFYPSLLHFSAAGELLEAPFTLDGLSSVDHPAGIPATLPRSRGFEGMAQSVDGNLLYPMLEGALINGGVGLNIYTFNTKNRRFENSHASEPSYRYRLDENSTAIGDFTLFSDTEGLVIERDSKMGGEAVVKRIYKVDFGQIDEDGFLHKTLLADLLNIKDPHDLNQDGESIFSFPFWTIEGLVVIDRTTLLIANDNNYPSGGARESPEGEPDNTEMIMLKVAPLWD